MSHRFIHTDYCWLIARAIPCDGAAKFYGSRRSHAAHKIDVPNCVSAPRPFHRFGLECGDSILTRPFGIPRDLHF